MNEQALLIPCGPQTLVGVLGLPAQPQSTAVVIVVGGPQYRVGSHRQFVLLARALATAGYAVLRFDYTGMGDSSGPAGDFLTASPGIQAAIDCMQEHVPTVDKIVLWGLCDAASAALLYVHETQDPRISGLCLLNPWVRSEVSQARTQVKHYYTQRLMQWAFWAKLLSGKVALGALKDLAHNLKLAKRKTALPGSHTRSFQERMAIAWNHFNGHILLVLSGNDYTAKEFLEFAANDTAWSTVFDHGQLQRHALPSADHTFSDPTAQAQVEMHTLHWMQTNHVD